MHDEKDLARRVSVGDGPIRVPRRGVRVILASLLLFLAGGCANSNRWLPVIPEGSPILTARLVMFPADGCAVRIPTADGGAITFRESDKERCAELLTLAKSVK